MCPMEPTGQEAHCSLPKTQNNAPQIVPWKNRPFISMKKGRQQSEAEGEREDEGKKTESRMIKEDDDEGTRRTG